MDVLQIKRNLPSDLYDQIKIIDGTLQEEQERCSYLEGIARRLFGTSFDLDQNPVFFCITDDSEPNISFVVPQIKNQAGKQNLIPVLTVTKGLINIVQNEDQLAFIMSYELKLIPAYFKNTDYSAGDSSDFNALKMLAQAKYNIAQAESLITHIFLNSQKYHSLSAKILKAFKQYPNNESMLNALQLKIQSLQSFYYKQDIDITAFEPTEIPVKFKTSVNKSYYKSSLRKLLESKKYDSFSLIEKQDILISALKEFIPPSKELTHNQAVQIEDVILSYVADLRRNMARKIVSQSDYELFKSYNPAHEELRQKRWQEIFHTPLPESLEHRISILESFPQKIVPDDAFETVSRFNNLLEEYQKRAIAEGTFPNVLFWDKLLDLETQLPDGDYLSIYNGCILSGIEDIDISKLPTGRNILEEFEKVFHNQEDPAYQRRVWSKFSNIRDCFSSDNPTTFLPQDLKFYPKSDSYLFKKFKLDRFPKLPLEQNGSDKGKTIPLIALRSSVYEKILGLTAKEIYKGCYIIHYRGNYREAPFSADVTDKSWFYICDNQGKILDSFSPKEYKAKLEDLLQTREDTIYRQLAKEIKQYYDIIRTASQNPQKIKNLSSKDLLHLKGLTGPYKYVAKSEAVSSLDYANALLKDNTSVAYPQKQPVENFIEDSFYMLKTSSEIYEGYSKFNELRFNKLLGPEILAFVNSKYSLENDNIIFEAYLSHVCNDVEHAEYGWSLNTLQPIEYEFMQFCKDALKSPRSVQFFSEAQFIKYYNTLFEKVGVKKLLDLGLLSKNNIVIPELKRLAVFALNEMAADKHLTLENINFQKYQPVFYEHIRKALDFPVDFADFKDEKLLQSSDDLAANIRTGMLLYIITDDKHLFPLEILSKYPLYELLDLQRAKLKPFLIKRENYPADILGMVKVYRSLREQGLIDDTESLSYIIKQIKKENNPQKALAASVEIAKTLDYIGDNQLKNMLIQDNPAFNVDLIGKIKAYQKLVEVNGFADDYVLQHQFLENFIPEIESIREPELKNSYYDIFINKQHRILDPDLRRRYQQLWVQSVFSSCGSQIDDKSESLYNKVKVYAQKLHGYSYEQNMFGIDIDENVNQADRLELSHLLAERFVAQKKLAFLLKPYPASFMEISEEDDGCRLQIAGFATIKSLISLSRTEADNLIDFLLTFGSNKDCEAYSQHLNSALQESQRSRKERISPQTLDMLYHEFWGYPIEARAVILGEVIQASNLGISANDWEHIFNCICKHLLPAVDDVKKQIVCKILHSYIKAHKNSERTLYLAAAMSAALETPATIDANKNLAECTRIFLENAGPVATRIAQSATVCLALPKYIRKELQKIKFKEQHPARWELFEWLDFYNTQDDDNKLDYSSNIWLGRSLSSNPYFITLEKGALEKNKSPFESDKVVKIVYAATKTSAEKEFKAFEDTLYDLFHDNLLSENINSLLQIITQTRHDVIIETDLSVGYEQLKAAQKTYNHREFEIDGYKIKLRVANWTAYGKTWAEMERSYGNTLDTIKNLRYRQVVNKIYNSLKLSKLISGGNVSNTEFGRQIRLNPETNTICIFDSGARATVYASAQDKKLLGKFLYQTFEKMVSSNFEGNLFRQFSVTLGNKIEDAYRLKQTTSSYLSDCLKTLLSVIDFYKDFQIIDLVDCINNALADGNTSIDESIITGFVDEGIKQLGLFYSEQNLLSYSDREFLGSMLFNMYADSFKYLPAKIGSVIKKEIIKVQQASEVKIPLLKIMADRIQELDKNSLSPDIPKEFMPTIGELIKRQNVDTAILKGIMKEVIYTINRQENNHPFSPEDRYEFGRLLYDTFNFTVAEKGEGETPDMITTYMMLYKSGNYKSQYAAKIAAIIKIAQSINNSKTNEDLAGYNAVRAILLSGKNDKEVIRGMSDTFKSRNPNSLTRSVAGKGLEVFLAQENTNPTALKKALIKLFVKGKETQNISSTDNYDEIHNSYNQKYMVSMIQNYITKLIRMYRQKKLENNNSITQ